jgi:hypothetical protein
LLSNLLVYIIIACIPFKQVIVNKFKFVSCSNMAIFGGVESFVCFGFYFSVWSVLFLFIYQEITISSGCVQYIGLYWEDLVENFQRKKSHLRCSCCFCFYFYFIIELLRVHSRKYAGSKQMNSSLFCVFPCFL